MPSARQPRLSAWAARPKFAHCSQNFKSRYLNVFTSDQFEINTKESGLYTNRVRTCCDSQSREELITELHHPRRTTTNNSVAIDKMANRMLSDDGVGIFHFAA